MKTGQNNIYTRVYSIPSSSVISSEFEYVSPFGNVNGLLACVNFFYSERNGG